MAIASPHLPRDNEQRLTRVESSLETVAGDVKELSAAVREQSRKTSDDFDRLSRELSGRLQSMQTDVARTREADLQARSPNWQLFLSAIGTCVVIVTAVGGMAFFPLYLQNTANRDSVNQALAWEMEYMTGKIPSSAEGQIQRVEATVNAKLVEIETQFRDKGYLIDMNAHNIGSHDERLRAVETALARVRP